MRSPLARLFHCLLAGLVTLAATARADAPIPASILKPAGAAEAWNVIRLATGNVDLLLTENRLSEIPVQISYCSPALRMLPPLASPPEAVGKVDTLVARAFVSVNALATAAQQGNPGGVAGALGGFRAVLKSIAESFDPAVVAADIFVCPMHSDVLSGNAKMPCVKCGMSLLTRRIPYSYVYTAPGEPTVRLTAIASAPVVAGKKIEVTVRMEKADHSPVLLTDLLEMHTQPIHLLIEEPGLGDYHHEHPTPTATPGEYAFSFTPAKTAPYRIWADIVPVTTGLQELPFVDLPSAEKGGAIENKETRFTSSAGGYRFTLTFPTGDQGPTRAGQVRAMNVAVSDSEGKPVTTLEPVMNAFSHLVGFYDDYKTVVHLHPTGGDVLIPTLRGGPSLGFLLFAPRPGFIRLYCQVSIGGKMLFAPFNLNVEE